MKGTIGEADQKGKLTYVCLIHQVKQVELMGYTHQDINNAVASSLSPSLALWTVLETTSSLSLETVEEFLVARFQKQNASIDVTLSQQCFSSLKKLCIHLYWDVWKLGTKCFCCLANLKTYVTYNTVCK